MIHPNKNGILLLLTLCIFFIPMIGRAQTLPTGDGQTAAQRLEAIRQPDSDERECQIAAERDLSSEGGGGGSYVPVHEIGDLLTVSTQNTGLTFQICMYTKTLKRIQYEWEDKELITNPDARKASAQAINDLRKGYFYGENGSNPGIARKQFYTSKQEEEAQAGQPIYITNTDQRIKNVSNEAEGLFLYDLSQKAQEQPLFTQSIKSTIAQNSAINQNDSTRLSQRLTSDFTSQQAFDDFTNDFNNGGWDAWLKIIQPNNNPYGQYMIAQEELGLRKSKAEQNAREEILAGGGFLPNRKCIANGWVAEPNSSVQFCKQWETLTPASAQANQYSQIWGATLNQAINADQQTEDFIKNELPVDQAHIISGIGATNPTNNIPQSIFDQEDRCPGPGPCPDTGWDGTGSSLPTGGGGGNQPTPTGLYSDPNGNGIPDFLENNRGSLPQGLQDFINGLLGQSLSPEERLRQIQEYLNQQGTLNAPPIVVMSASVPTYADRANNPAQPDQATITYSAWNASSCKTENDWYYFGSRTGTDLGSGSHVLKTRAQSLNKNGGAVTVDLPIRFPVSFAGNVNPNFVQQDTPGALSESLSSDTITQIITLNLNNSILFRNWLYPAILIRVANNDITVPAPTLGTTEYSSYSHNRAIARLRDTVAGILSNTLDDRQKNLVFFNWTYNTPTGLGIPYNDAGNDSGSATVTIRPTYTMSCTNQSGTTHASVTLQRQ